MNHARFFYLFFVLGVLGCGGDRDECVFDPPVSEKLDLDFAMLGDSLAAIRNKAELVTFLTEHPVIRDEMLSRAAYPNDSAFINEILRRFTNPAIDTLLDETRSVFKDGSLLKAQFSEAFENIKYYFPDFKPPKVKTIISGLDTDLFVSDTLIIVSLDFFIGKTASYRPKTYDYLLRRYDPEDIVPSCMLIYGISERFNNTNLRDRSVLADMVAYGKSFYFAKHMLPCTPDSTLLWYTSEEISGANNNEDLIWARLVQDKILFSTSAIDKRNYLGDRPVTIQVGEKCPGRIGQWVGWQVVKKYMDEHPNTSLPELMKMSDAQTIFKKSNYKPQNL